MKRLGFALFCFLLTGAVGNASVIYTYSHTEADATISFSLTTQSYITSGQWFYQFDSCQGVYGLACNQALLAQDTPTTVSIDLLLDGGTTEYAEFSNASLSQDGVYSSNGATLTVVDPPSSVPEPSLWLLSASGLALLGCMRRLGRK